MANKLIAPRQVQFVHLGLPEARYYIACAGHMHVFRRVGYRSNAFIEDAIADLASA